jgi:hypothetical protein
MSSIKQYVTLKVYQSDSGCVRERVEPCEGIIDWLVLWEQPRNAISFMGPIYAKKGCVGRDVERKTEGDAVKLWERLEIEKKHTKIFRVEESKLPIGSQFL